INMQKDIPDKPVLEIHEIETKDALWKIQQKPTTNSCENLPEIPLKVYHRFRDSLPPIPVIVYHRFRECYHKFL
ncbi:MAG: hypothetical protein QG641_922, partial [Candidatus Poribacteria bacterium]|nr:hypothetical protein [Candidatus Poribacteria bacterium]